MVWVYYLLLILLDLAGIGLVAFTLPGLWLMLAAAALFSLMTRGHYLGWHTLVLLLVCAAGAEIGEIALGGAGAKKAGASKWGMVGGFVGAILGGIFLTALIPLITPLNVIIGICLGTFLGAFSTELLLGQEMWSSLKIGFGAAKGRLFGIVGKVGVGLVMMAVSLWAALPLHRHKVVSTAFTGTPPRSITTAPTTVAAPVQRP